MIEHAHFALLLSLGGPASFPHQTMINACFSFPPPSSCLLVTYMAMDPALKAKLLEAGAYFHDWPDDGPTAVRMVTAFNTLETDVDAVIAAAHA